jgi:excisionase family DNA binding protein
MRIQDSRELSVAETARQLGIGLQYTYTLIYSGKLRARRVNRRWFVPADAVEARRKLMEERDAKS